jgi:hypothetical protein
MLNANISVLWYNIFRITSLDIMTTLIITIAAYLSVIRFVRANTRHVEKEHGVTALNRLTCHNYQPQPTLYPVFQDLSTLLHLSKQTNGVTALPPCRMLPV